MNLRSVIYPACMLVSLSCGVDGTSGRDGLAGQQGAEGQQGMTGSQGPAGPTGPAGMNGRDALGATDTSGTRLKRYASVLTAVDGLKVTTPSYLLRDTTLGIDCVFQSASDGMQRCLPSTSKPDVGLAYSSSYFSDAGCTQLLHFATKPCAALKYVLVNTTSTATCPAVGYVTVYAAPPTVTPSVMYTGSPGACTALAKPSIDSLLMSFVVYDLNGKTPVSPTTFVSGTSTQVLLP